jgi:hypothetical protein
MKIMRKFFNFIVKIRKQIENMKQKRNSLDANGNKKGTDTNIPFSGLVCKNASENPICDVSNPNLPSGPS